MATALAADIPIREVILYKSGVGYFERAGQLSPGESARLDFKATDMNDVLKSLTLAGSQWRQGYRPPLRFERAAGAEAGRVSVQDRAGSFAELCFCDQMKGAAWN